jgi:nucleoside-diphosphate-sugar epimerase
MNILVTGANGLLGRYLVELLSKKHKVFAIVKNIEKLNFEINENITVLEMDLSIINLEVLPKHIEAIYYLAQSNRFREFPDGVDDMLSINVLAPNILAKWAVKTGVKKFIYASSGGVYTNPNKPVKEFFDINANEKLGFYLNSKLSAEMLLKNYASLFETFAIIRPFFMYGVGQNETMLIPRLISSVQNEKEITLNGQNGIKINPIYVTDAANAVAKILELQGEFIINIAGKEAVSLKELCQ